MASDDKILGPHPRISRPTTDDKVLRPHPRISRPTTLLICVLDGWGESSAHDDAYNAIAQARTPCMDALKATAPRHWRLLKAHGTAVGLPSDADMGNSEVGHNALGAGQIVDQGAKCVDKALASGAVFELEGWKWIEAAAKAQTLHLIGLLSDGGVHSRYDQLMALMQGAMARGVTRIRLHVLADGRDVEDFTADQWLERLQRDITALSASTGTDIQIASGGGRMRVTMDRYGSDWAIVKRGWEAHVLGQAPNRFRDAVAGVRGLQVRDGVRVSDQQLEPWVVVDGTGSPVGPIVDGDAVVTFNFRADRMVEICQAFEDETFTAFDRQRWPQVRFAGMMVYDNELGLPKHYLVPPPVIENASEEYLLASGCKVFATAESQKIGHVTFFWRGNKGGAVPGAKYVEVASDTGISFDTAPEMKAKEVAATARDAILSKQYSVVRCNFANPDMVAHTGSLEATVRACTTVDACVAQLLSAVDAVGGRWLVTADHGNAEEMVQRDKAGAAVMDAQGRPVPLTSHTLNPVPCAIGGAGLPPGVRFREDLPPSAGLANVAATYMNLLGFEAPPFYEPSLITVD